MRRHRSLTYLTLSGLTTAALYSTPAAAQQQIDPAASTGASDGQAATASTGDAETGDIVVTATKTGQQLDRAPISAVSLDSGELDRLAAVSVRDAQIRLPSVVYNDSGGSAQVYIRGIGTNSAYAGLESSIGTYQDGVYLQRQVGASLDVLDLSSIQVLQGPQGSLYGRNATGGVILVNTNDPRLGAFEGHVEATGGSYGRAEGEAVLNVPVADNVALRVAGRYSRLGGYVRNIAAGNRLGGYDQGTVRAKLKWSPGSRLDVVAAFEYHDERDDPLARRLLTAAPLCTACAVFGSPPSPADRFYQVSQTKTADTRIRYTAGTLRVNYAADTIDVVSVSGVRGFHYKVYVDQDYAAPDLFRTRAEEFGTTFTNDTYARSRFSGAFNFLVGVSGEIDHDTLIGELDGVAFGPLAGATNNALVKLRSISPYAEAYVQLPEQFKLTLGGRYNIDTKTLISTSNAAGVAAVGATPAFTERVTYRNFTPRAVLSHETDTATIYASIGRGAKSGGFNTPAFSPIIPLRPEKLTSYEVGLKAHSTDRMINLSAAGFYYDYRDIQVSFVDAASGAVRAQNAARAHVYGAELNLALHPVTGLSVSAGGTLLHARFADYRSAAVFCPASYAVAGCPPPTGRPGLVNAAVDLSGARLPRSPELSYSLSVDYQFPLSDRWEGVVGAADKYTTGYDLLAGGGGPLGLSRQPAFHLATASLTLRQRERGLMVRAFVANLANARYYLDLPTSAFGVAGSAAPPRTVGGTLGYSF